MFPDFIIIGTQKGGTSSLFYYLSQHPEIKTSFNKEVHFFDLNFGKGIEWYKLQFPKENKSENYLFGESSPYYLFHPLVPERVKKTCPNVKLIVMLRNPLDRAYSHFCMQKKRGIEKYNQFDFACAAEKHRLNGEFEKIISDKDYNSYNYQKYSYLTRSLYSTQIERWFEYFPKENFLFLKSESFFYDTISNLNNVYDFLNIRHHNPHDLSKQNSNEYDPMPLGYKKKIDEYFVNEKNKIIQLLGENFKW